MTVAATTLLTAASGLADVLSDAAVAYGWTPSQVCVTPVEPGFGCDEIHVWFGGIRPDTVRGAPDCEVASIVELSWAVSHCIGADRVESCAWWGEAGRTDEALARLWVVWGGLVVAQTSGVLCTALGARSCRDVSLGPVGRFESGDLAVYSGTVSVRLDVTTVGGS